MDERSQLHDQITELLRELDRHHKNLRAFAAQVEEIEAQAVNDQIRAALREAYVRISQAGSVLVQAHLGLSKLAAGTKEQAPPPTEPTQPE